MYNRSIERRVNVRRSNDRSFLMLLITGFLVVAGLFFFAGYSSGVRSAKDPNTLVGNRK